MYITRPAEREQSQSVIFRQNKNTGALVRDTGTLRVSSNFFWTLGRFGSRKIIFSNFGDFYRRDQFFLRTCVPQILEIFRVLLSKHSGANDGNR